MTDIVERLRKAGLRDGFAVILYQHVQQAADEIERLRNTIKNCPPVSESEYVRRLEDEVERLGADNERMQKLMRGIVELRDLLNSVEKK